MIFTFIICYLLYKDDFDQITINKIYYTIFVMLFSLTLWIISNYYKNKILNIIFVLCIIISNIYLLYVFYNINEIKYYILKILSIIAILYILFHHIFIDLILWNTNE